ncbi:uncharacterized protein IL334_005160 [Kwoniella shivajii]|uniref:Rab-GAP TBC domain-containing protein n=1 Tax=Kwoniella shivajii TaxID=564305 RepID=A0ABZ1D2C9_9TREE|nr:hypothetical protein IL334_005160 [Kwoniella shivajii]
MVETNQPRPKLRSTDTSRSHPLTSSSTSTSHPQITRRVSSGNSFGGVPLVPSISLPASSDHTLQQEHAMHNSKLPTYRRPHANTISTTRPSRRSIAGLNEVDLLGGGSSHRIGKQSGQLSNLSSPTLGKDPILEEVGIRNKQGRYSSPIRDNASTSKLVGYLDSLNKEELSIVDTRFDLMSDEELNRYVSLAVSAHTNPLITSIDCTDQSPAEDTSEDAAPLESPSMRRPSSSQSAQNPLFPPSPPPQQPILNVSEHPLRVLSKAVAELREVVEKLNEENERLREETLPMKRVKSRRKSVDQMSIHDGLTEAISTSLTSDTGLHPGASNAFYTVKDTSSIRSSSPTPSHRRAMRPSSIASSLSVPFPSSPITPNPPTAVGSRSFGQVTKPKGFVEAESRKSTASTWTSGLWVWNTGKKPGGKNGTIDKHQPTGSALTSDPTSRLITKSTIETDDGESDVWRKGDGGSSPSFKAIFLATRIITPDPSSILNSSEIPSNSLIAYLAHSLVSNARDEGIIARDYLSNRRRSRDLTRGRAASTASHNSIHVDAESLRDSKPSGYSDQAIAATATLGRTLLSSVSSATMRGTRAIANIGEESRPSLLSRTSSARAFPTTAVSAPSAVGQSGTSTTLPTDERPLPSVEMASIVPDDIRPPTVTLSRHNLGSFFQNSKSKLVTASRFESDDEPLTDRYGFIYDIQHAKMLKDASVAGTSAPMSLNGTIPPNKHVEGEGWIDKRRRGSQGSERSTNREMKPNDVTDSASVPTSRRSLDSKRPPPSRTPENGSPPKARSSSQIEAHRHRSSTLLSLNPSPARAVTAKEHLTVSARGASSLQSAVTTNSLPPLSASLSHAISSPDVSESANPSRSTVSSLLEQLTEIHDRQQQERQKEWDAFLRRRARHIQESGSSGGHLEEDVRWGSGLIGIGQMGVGGKSGHEDWKAFTRLVRKGIPLKYRSDVWAECSGARDLMVPGEYAEILAVHKEDKSPVFADIEKDVSRTFPGNVFFGGDGPGVGKLRRVLTAYSWHNPAVGYCQGMNMLAATLLLTHTDEEQAYWVLTSLIDRLLPPSFYSASLLASRADQAVLSDLVAQLVPKVHNHLEDLGVDLASVTFGWWLSLFTDCLPVETLFRVWDVTFVEGHDTLFRVAIAILKLNENEISGTESVSDLFTFISTMTSRLWNADKLIALQHSYKPIIRHIDIVARCEKAVADLQKEIGDV